MNMKSHGMLDTETPGGQSAPFKTLEGEISFIDEDTDDSCRLFCVVGVDSAKRVATAL